MDNELEMLKLKDTYVNTEPPLDKSLVEGGGYTSER